MTTLKGILLIVLSVLYALMLRGCTSNGHKEYTTEYLGFHSIIILLLAVGGLSLLLRDKAKE